MKTTKKAIKIFLALRKKNWSAPTIMSAFILFCMLLVYGFETLGLLNKERNLDMRSSNPESSIKLKERDFKLLNKEKNYSKIIVQRNLTKNDYITKKIKHDSKKNKEKNIEFNKRILIDGAREQNNYENLQNYKFYNEKNFKKINNKSNYNTDNYSNKLQYGNNMDFYDV